MPTIDEIRETIQEHQEYGYADISLGIAVTLLAEVERLNAIANRLLNDVEIEGYSSAANVYREELKGNQND